MMTTPVAVPDLYIAAVRSDGTAIRLFGVVPFFDGVPAIFPTVRGAPVAVQAILVLAHANSTKGILCAFMAGPQVIGPSGQLVVRGIDYSESQIQIDLVLK